MTLRERFRGCMLGGAVGDALGHPIEFMDMDMVRRTYGEEGLKDLVPDARTGVVQITDDTQMTIFTVNGLMLLEAAGCLPAEAGKHYHTAYQRWLYTQRGNISDKAYLRPLAGDAEPFVMDLDALYVQRSPGMSCLSALQKGRMGTPEEPVNESKGCGGVMRAAPIGLYYCSDPKLAFRSGCLAAAITHGNPTGYLTAGALAMIISRVVNDIPLRRAVEETMEELKTWPGHEETMSALRKALALSESDMPSWFCIARLGAGWVAEETLSISLYCALKSGSAADALVMAVNHDGDSDSTGAVCGNLVGAIYGLEALPKEWVEQVELSDYIAGLADWLLAVQR